MPIRVRKFTRCTKFYKNNEFNSPNELKIINLVSELKIVAFLIQI